MKNDNSHIEEKLDIRQEVVRGIGKDKVRVLECYAGAGRMWSSVKVDGVEISVTRIEIAKGKNKRALEGDCMKFLPSMNLDKYDIVDLDAYGIPAEQIRHLYDRGYMGKVIVTAIQSMQGSLPNAVLYANGFTDAMLSKSRTLFNRNGLAKLENFLYICGVKKIHGYFFGNERKNYFYFNF